MDFIIPNFKKDDLLFSTFQYYIIVVLEVVFLFLLKYFSNPFPILWFVYAALPWLDYFLPHDLRNPTNEEAKYLRESVRFKIPLYVSTIVNWIAHAWTLNWLVQNDFRLSYFGIISTIVVLGTFGGTNINLSHELIHKDDKLERCMGILNLGRWFYQHWYVEHLWDHHKNVGTYEDAATSRKNQSFYSFFPVTVWGAIKSAWHLEKQRCEIKYGTVWTINNKWIYFMLNNFGLPYLSYKIWGTMGVVYFLATTSVAVFYMEMINYIEHYGLHREANELVTIHHSWNTPHRISNYVLFKLQRHSDHHENAFKPYQTLCSYDESPTMPQGYPLMVLLSLFPQRWFSIMNVLLAHATKQKISKAEVDAALKDCQKFADQAFMVFTGLLALSCFI